MPGVTIEVRCGPAMRAALDVLDLAHDLLEVLPDYEYEYKEELRQRVAGLSEIVATTLKVQPNAGRNV